MQNAVLNPLPRWGAVVAEQFRSVGLALRREAMVAAGIMGLGTAWIAAVTLNHSGLTLAPQAGVPMAFLALLIPMAVWKGEDPARRGYHRAMPVHHAAHATVRSVSGLGWTMVAVAAFLGWVGLLAAASGGGIDSAPGWRWVVPFTSAAVMYILGSALALATAHPWRWLGGAVAGYLFLSTLRFADGSRGVFEAVRQVVEGRLGLLTLITGVAPAHYLHHDVFVSRQADFSAWLLATWLWLAVAISLFALAAYRQPER